MSEMKQHNNDKEVAAVAYRLKQEMILEKTVQMLSIEEDYACKLLDLDQQIMKSKYRRFKNKVSKIKSHLDADEIVEFRELEQEGRLKQQYTSVTISFASKIAAAARRLKMDRQNRCKSAFPGLNGGSEKEPTSPKETPRTPESTNFDLRRANSVTGAFIDVPTPDAKKRRSSVDGSIAENGKQNSQSDLNGNGNDNQKPIIRAATTLGHSLKKQRDRVPTPLRRAQTAHGLRNPMAMRRYSSHAAVEKEAAKANAPPPPEGLRRSSIDSTSSFGSAFGVDPYKVRRKNFLEYEHRVLDNFNNKKISFLEKVGKTVTDNPPYIPKTQKSAEEIIGAIEMPQKKRNENKKGSFHQKALKRLISFSVSKGSYDGLTEEQQAAKYLQEWNKMKKHRYIRVPAETADLSGIQTLAFDQMKVFNSWKQPIKASRNNTLQPSEIELFEN